jgi:hypothetical protein
LAIVVTSIIVVVDEGDAVASVLPGPAVSYTTSWDSTFMSADPAHEGSSRGVKFFEKSGKYVPTHRREGDPINRCF